jgi:hypothetical protein
VISLIHIRTLIGLADGVALTYLLSGITQSRNQTQAGGTKTMPIRATATRHAEERFAERGIPHGIADIIVDFGICEPARDNALRHWLDRRALRDIGRSYGPEIARVLGGYRTAFVITEGDRIVTAVCQTASAAKAAQRSTAH